MSSSYEEGKSKDYHSDPSLEESEKNGKREKILKDINDVISNSEGYLMLSDYLERGKYSEEVIRDNFTTWAFAKREAKSYSKKNESVQDINKETKPSRENLNVSKEEDNVELKGKDIKEEKSALTSDMGKLNLIRKLVNAFGSSEGEVDKIDTEDNSKVYREDNSVFSPLLDLKSSNTTENTKNTDKGEKEVIDRKKVSNTKELKNSREKEKFEEDNDSISIFENFKRLNESKKRSKIYKILKKSGKLTLEEIGGELGCNGLNKSQKRIIKKTLISLQFRDKIEKRTEGNRNQYLISDKGKKEKSKEKISKITLEDFKEYERSSSSRPSNSWSRYSEAESKYYIEFAWTRRINTGDGRKNQILAVMREGTNFVVRLLYGNLYRYNGKKIDQAYSAKKALKKAKKWMKRN